MIRVTEFLFIVKNTHKAFWDVCSWLIKCCIHGCKMEDSQYLILVILIMIPNQEPRIFFGHVVTILCNFKRTKCPLNSQRNFLFVISLEISHWSWNIIIQTTMFVKWLMNNWISSVMFNLTKTIYCKEPKNSIWKLHTLCILKLS